MSSAYEELQEYLDEGEVVEAVVFGSWGWGGYDEPNCNYDEDDAEFPAGNNPAVPYGKRGVLLTLEEAEPFMKSWTFYGGYGSPDCYATYIWTDRHVIWVTQYDGSTSLSCAPRHPLAIVPGMPGG